MTAAFVRKHAYRRRTDTSRIPGPVRLRPKPRSRTRRVLRRHRGRIASFGRSEETSPRERHAPQSKVNAPFIRGHEPRVHGRLGVPLMKRVLIAFAAAFALLLGTSLPVSAALELPIRIDCSDGDSIDLTVDLDTLTALTSSVAAINESDTDLTCTLVQLAAPSLVFNSANTALAASGGYVIGAGTVDAGCPPNFDTSFRASFSVKMYTKSGVLRGS